MGAVLIIEKSKGNSMSEAYDDAVEQAIYENGNDRYNGTISTTSGFIDHTSQFRRSGKSIEDYAHSVDKNGLIQKWGSTLGICMSEPVVNNNKIKTQVNTMPQVGARTWLTTYVVQLYNGRVVGSDSHQTNAIKIAREYTEKTKENTYVHITKKLVGAKTLVSEISYKKSDKEQTGLYCFIGIAAE
jgi:hypothetical protein